MTDQDKATTSELSAEDANQLRAITAELQLIQVSADKLVAERSAVFAKYELQEGDQITGRLIIRKQGDASAVEQ